MKRFRLVIVFLLIVFLAIAYILGWSSLFTVKSVKFTGTNVVLPTSIMPGDRLARVEPREVATGFEKLEWVKNAQVTRNWISGEVTISITARKAIAIFNDRAIDEEGKSFPLLKGKTDSLPRVQAQTIEQAVNATLFFNKLPRDFSNSIELLRVRMGGFYILEMGVEPKAIEIVWGRDEENSLKIRVYRALMERRENREVFQIDLSAPHAPIVK